MQRDRTSSTTDLEAHDINSSSQTREDASCSHLLSALPKKYGDISRMTKSIVDFQEDKISGLLRRTAWQYQIGIQTVKNDEIFVMDEGFYHRAQGIAARTNAYELPTKTNYFDVTPHPDFLVHFKAPDAEIVNRNPLWNEYGDAELVKTKQTFVTLDSQACQYGINVIEIDDIGDPDEVSDRLIGRNMEHIE